MNTKFRVKKFSKKRNSTNQVARFIGKKNYDKLNQADRENQALKIYNKRWLDNMGIGKKYERYLQFYFENQGWDVYNNGIRNGYKDLGRDLICFKSKTIKIIQAKYWSSNKIIYSKHIHQLSGSADSYQFCKKKFENYKIEKYFCYRNIIDSIAKKEARNLNIKLKFIEMDYDYPKIKCNISKKGKKNYYLPFDSYYDLVKINKKGEFYCTDVTQALQMGFIRD